MFAPLSAIMSALYLVLYFTICTVAGGKPKEKCGMSPYKDAGTMNSRIINGQTARPNEFPWQVSVRYHRNHICGGIILNKDFILTAAHCLQRGNKCDYSIIAGAQNQTDEEESTQQHIWIEDMKFHPKYTNNPETKTGYGDISVVKLDKPLTLNKNVMPACMPDKTHDLYINRTAIISGWGVSYDDIEWDYSPDLLQFTEIRVMPLEFCADFISNTPYTRYIQPDMYCLSGGGYSHNRSACFGDSGGPMVVKEGGLWYNIGVTTGGLGGCAQGAPFRYRSVPYHLDWIRQTMKAM